MGNENAAANEGFDIQLDALPDYVDRVTKRYPLAAPEAVARLASCWRQLDYHEAILAIDPGFTSSENAYLKLVPIWCRLVGVMGDAAAGLGDEITPVRRKREF